MLQTNQTLSVNYLNALEDLQVFSVFKRRTSIYYLATMNKFVVIALLAACVAAAAAVHSEESSEESPFDLHSLAGKLLIPQSLPQSSNCILLMLQISFYDHFKIESVRVRRSPQGYNRRRFGGGGYPGGYGGNGGYGGGNPYGGGYG